MLADRAEAGGASRDHAPSALQAHALRDTTDPRLVDGFRAGGRIVAGGVIAISVTALIGWTFDAQILRAFGPNLVPMNPATAVAFVALALSLLLGTFGRSSAATALAAVGGSIGLVRLAAVVLGWDVGLDRILFPDALAAAGGGFPNRMAPNTAVWFFLLGSSLTCLHRDRAPALAQILAASGLLAAVVGLAGYAYRLSTFYGVEGHIPMALNTAFGFLLLSLGTLLLHSDRGIMPIFSSRTIGGTLARWLLPLTLVLPLVLGWLRLMGQERGLYGTEFGVALLAVANASAFGTLIGFLARLLARSDARRQRAERELEHRLLELDAVNRELESFSYAVSHDLRSPLRSIAGFALALREDCASALDEAGESHLRRIEAATHRMGELIDGLLGLSRITRADLVRQPVDLATISRELVEDLARADGSSDVLVTIDDDLDVEGDPRLLRVALQNLLANAWKYTAREPARRIEVGSAGDNGQRVFYVRDNGAGFDMAYADKLFAAFQRLHAATDFEGTGIGLATVNRIIHRHGGRIWGQGAVGEGATFYFTLGEEFNDG